MEAGDENVRNAHVFDLKLLKEFYLVFGIYNKIHSIRDLSIGEGKYHKKNNLTYFTWFSTHQH